MISCCIFGLATRLNVISQNSETYQTLVGKFLLFFPKSGSQTLNFLLMWPEIIILLKESMCNDLCVPVLVKPTNDVTLFYANAPHQVQIHSDLSCESVNFILLLMAIQHFGLIWLLLPVNIFQCSFNYFSQILRLSKGYGHQVICNWPILQDEAKKLCPLRCLLMLWPKKLTQNNDFLPVYGVF